MEDFLSFAQERRSYRRFNKKPVSLEIVADCLLAASFAPSAGDIQPWEFVVVFESKNISAVARACEDQDWVHDAQVLVVVLADYLRAETYHGDVGRAWARDSCCAATQNVLLAAHQRGVGSCWVSSFDADLLQEAIGFPDHVAPVSVVALGYSDELLIEKEVTPLDQFTYFEEYGRARTDESEDMSDYGEVFQRRLQSLSERSSAAKESRYSSESGVRSWFDSLLDRFKK